MQDAVGIAGARIASTWTTPMQGGITGTSRGADVIVLAVLAAKVPVSLILFSEKSIGQRCIPEADPILRLVLTKPTP